MQRLLGWPGGEQTYAILKSILLIVILLLPCSFLRAQNSENDLKLNGLGYFEASGLNVLVFSNWYDGNFSDAKISGIELIHHGVRTATNGDVRLSPTPGQWDPIPTLVERKVDKQSNTVEVSLKYPDYDFRYEIRAQAKDGGILISVIVQKPLPQVLAGRAGFNLEFLPSAYFEKTYLIDRRGGVFPLHPAGSMDTLACGNFEPRPLASGKSLILAPEDPGCHVTIQSKEGDLQLYDGRNLAQNGWFVVRSLIPAEKTGKVIEWLLRAQTIPHWIRTPVIGHSQVGYVPLQRKIAVIELDKNDKPESSARLFRVNEDGSLVKAYEGVVKTWGQFLRYDYLTFDFSSVR